MGNIYRLPCSCGHALDVPVTQAGSVQSCPECGALVEVPPLRQLRQLPPVEPPSGHTDGSAGRWSLGQGLAFSVGMLLVAACLLAVVLLARERQTLRTAAPQLAELHSHSDPDQLTPSQIWQGWVSQFRDERLEGRETPMFLQERARYRRLTGWIWAAGGGVAIGALLALGAALMAWPRGRPAR
jgi:hypothetical protein